MAGTYVVFYFIQDWSKISVSSLPGLQDKIIDEKIVCMATITRV